MNSVHISTHYKEIENSTINRQLVNEQYKACFNKYTSNTNIISEILNKDVCSIIMSFISVLDDDFNSSLFNFMKYIHNNRLFTNDTYRLYKANTFDIVNHDIICLIKFNIFINSHSYLNFSHYSNPLYVCYVKQKSARKDEKKYIILNRNMNVYKPKRLCLYSITDIYDNIYPITELDMPYKKYVHFDILKLSNKKLLTFNEVIKILLQERTERWRTKNKMRRLC